MAGGFQSTGLAADVVMYAGSEGKHRIAHDIVIPPDAPEAELERYLADLCHEWALPARSAVRRLR